MMTRYALKNNLYSRTSLGVHCLRLHASNTRGTGLLPGQGTEIPHTSQPKDFFFFFKKNSYSYYSSGEQINEVGAGGDSVPRMLEAGEMWRQGWVEICWQTRQHLLLYIPHHVASKEITNTPTYTRSHQHSSFGRWMSHPAWGLKKVPTCVVMATEAGFGPLVWTRQWKRKLQQSECCPTSSACKWSWGVRHWSPEGPTPKPWGKLAAGSPTHIPFSKSSHD